MAMKKIRYLYCIIIAVAVAVLIIFFNKTAYLNLNFNFTLPKSAEIVEFQRRYFCDYTIKQVLAKVEISKADYNKFLKSVSGKYYQYTLEDCYIDEQGDYWLPDVIDCEADVGLEDSDIDVQGIKKICYREQNNPISRHPNTKKIYVTEADDKFIIYMYRQFGH